jgi:hypothetical protein
MPKMPNRHFLEKENGIDGKYYSILAQLIMATDDGNAEKTILFILSAEKKKAAGAPILQL